MALTLEDAKMLTTDAVQKGVIDEFQKSNWIMQHMQFADAVSPVGGGATLTYAYNRIVTQPTAAFRAINAEYTPQEITTKRFSVDLAVFGGSFEIDRVLAGMNGLADQVTLQMQQKIKATSALFNDSVINGDSATNAAAFDGLEKALTGSSTEVKPAAAIDLSDSAAIDTNYKAFLDQVDLFLANLDGMPSGLLMNGTALAKFRAVARRSSAYQMTMDQFGRQVESYNGIPLVNVGTKAGTNDPVVPIDAEAGTTSIYAVRLGLDGLHGVTTEGGNQLVRTWLPDFATAGAVKKGEVEMLAAIALKATKAAGVLRNIKVK
jgi:hypothetical protein